MTSSYTEVTAITSLPTSHYLYEANCDIECAGCSAIIPVNSYFACKVAKGGTTPVPHCRRCRPFVIFTNPQRTEVALRDEEWLHVGDSGEEVES